VIRVCSFLDVVNVEEFLVESPSNNDYENLWFNLMPIDSSPLVGVKVTYSTTNTVEMNKTLAALKQMYGVVDIKIYR
jgi:hypothetical protein